MKLTRVLPAVLFLFISTCTVVQASGSLGQVRNSLWVFGVNDSVSTEVQMVGQEIAQFSQAFDSGVSDENNAGSQALEVPEELDTAIAKFES